METLNNIITVPSWAYDFCYYYFFVAVLVVITTVVTIFQLVFLPAIVKKSAPVTITIVALILSSIVTSVLAMMQFWICRSALKPSKAVNENFAVKCENPSDCKAVMGSNQGENCVCGGRGLCGGCVMQNNTEPSMLDNAAELAPFGMEGFRGSMRPAIKTNKADKAEKGLLLA
jgi:hypothetical protein